METSDELRKSESLAQEPDDIFQCQLDAMGEAGLDLAPFERFLADHDLLYWPQGSLSAYFNKLDEDLTGEDDVDAAYFEHLGIKPDKAAELAEKYPGWEEIGWLPTELLVLQYESVADKVRREILQESLRIQGYDLDSNIEHDCRDP